MDLGTKKLPGSGEAPREEREVAKPPNHFMSAIFDANCKLQGIATVFLSKMNLRRRWKVCSLAWEAALKILNHGKRVNCKISGVERYKTSLLQINQAEVVCQFTASSPAANSTGWSCLPIRFMREKVTLVRRNSRGIINFLKKYSYIYRTIMYNSQSASHVTFNSGCEKSFVELRDTVRKKVK